MGLFSTDYLANDLIVGHPLANHPGPTPQRWDSSPTDRSLARETARETARRTLDAQHVWEETNDETWENRW